MSAEGYLLPAEVRALLLETDERIKKLTRQRDELDATIADLLALSDTARGELSRLPPEG